MAERFDADETDASEGVGTRMEAVRRLEGTARALKLVAIVAGVLWAAVTLALFWTYWDASASGGFLAVTGPMNDDGRLVRVVGQSLQASWGWALVAVVAAASSGLITLQRLRFGAHGLDGE
jgi:hypothetical protein